MSDKKVAEVREAHAQQRLYLMPEPQGQGLLRLVLRVFVAAERCSLCWGSNASRCIATSARGKSAACAISILVFIERVINLNEAGQESNKGCKSLILRDFCPVVGRQLHRVPETPASCVDFMVIGNLVLTAETRGKAGPPLR